MSATRALEQLYAVSPKEFIRTRNSLAAQLRKSGDADAAREVAGLRRPSAALWAVNQLARHARAALERFLDAVDQLRRTQLSNPRGAMDAMRAERAQLETLVGRAGQALVEVGYAASAEMRRRIGDTLLGAATDRRHAEALAHGRLTEELHAPGFDALTGAPRLRVVPGGASQRDGRSAADDTRARPRDARAAVTTRATAAARARDERTRAKTLAREEKARERAAKAEERQREAAARRQEAEARAAELAALEREAAAARERLAEVQGRLKAARRGPRRRPR